MVNYIYFYYVLSQTWDGVRISATGESVLCVLCSQRVNLDHKSFAVISISEQTSNYDRLCDSLNFLLLTFFRMYRVSYDASKWWIKNSDGTASIRKRIQSYYGYLLAFRGSGFIIN